MEVRYYHLQHSSLEQALPQLLLKTLERDWRAVVRLVDMERVRDLNHHLWTFDDRTFLPHGSEEDGEADLHPVWLTDKEENPNGASVLFLTDGMNNEKLEGYELVCRLFDGGDEAVVARTREQWKTDRDAGRKLTYWQQTPQGWTKQAEANGVER